MTKNLSILGCGWLGERIGKAFLEKGWSVNGSSRSEKRLAELKSMGIEGFKVDLEELSKVNNSFFEVDVLVIATTNKNHIAHQNLVKLIEKSAVKKVFFISSTSVYEKSKERITLNTPLVSSPLVEVEKVYLSFAKAFILRCGGLIGDNRQPGNFFKKGARIKNLDGKVKLIHFKDVISQIESLLENESKQVVYNLIEESHFSRYDFYSKAYEELHGENGEFRRNN